MMIPMPPDEQFRRFLRLSSVAYALGALNAALLRRTVDSRLRWLDQRGDAPPDFWHTLGTAYMATIAALAWAAGSDRTTARRLAGPLLVAKGTTTGIFALRFVRTRRRSYALGALTDGAIVLATAYLAARARSRGLRMVEDNVVHMHAS